ncbi:hypothetical protein CB0940_03656 [Cercospora beticola]|uniref:Mitochondrial K+-H+ exchange-related-domain-containing protein n=1 Tax=Cercospora beticola TaxID=122368 RepID=A0A2G5I5C7_CERBT|nr:hypothetical protein CB0940_03656 [Cercospora beticola]PIB00017.1 hypothetical protein CB0940_03656 [Cercospora beticola]WPB00836.1 hypothetical protein RHO25_005456 [Cercospora beticola]
MRLFLLPVSTRRTLIYCERVQEAATGAGTKPPLQERIITKAATTWANWEKAEKGWQKQTTVYANKLFRRIPFEEWGLKTIPPATKQRIADIDQGNLQVECLYPGAFLNGSKVPEILKRLATERQVLHRKRIWQSIALMPVVAPFALVPVIPNLPFFYLVWRAWSHYKALYGGRLLEHLVTHNHIKIAPSAQMDQLYAAGLISPSREATRGAPQPNTEEIKKIAKVVEAQTQNGTEDAMLLQKWNGKLLAEGFKLPEMEIEIERAVEQVEQAIKESKPEGDLQAKKEELQEVIEKKTPNVQVKETKQ